MFGPKTLNIYIYIYFNNFGLHNNSQIYSPKKMNLLMSIQLCMHVQQQHLEIEKGVCTWVRFPPRTPFNFYSELSISHCLFLSFCLPIACAHHFSFYIKPHSLSHISAAHYLQKLLLLYFLFLFISFFSLFTVSFFLSFVLLISPSHRLTLSLHYHTAVMEPGSTQGFSLTQPLSPFAMDLGRMTFAISMTSSSEMLPLCLMFFVFLRSRSGLTVTRRPFQSLAVSFVRKQKVRVSTLPWPDPRREAFSSRFSSSLTGSDDGGLVRSDPTAD